MSKLVKLSTTLDTNRDTNGYVCISDNDIILSENAKVSLLNAHLSSGIITDYKINGVNTDNVVDNGKEILNLNLGDRDRNVIIPNSNYDITGLLNEIQYGLDRTCTYQSTPNTPVATTGTLAIPTDQDYGLCHLVTLDSDSKVKISYNSNIPKYNQDLNYSVKDVGISVTNGVITYNGAAAPVQYDLDKTQAQQNPKSVLVTGDTPGLAVHNVVKLVRTGAAGAIPPRDSKVISIVTETSNTNKAVALDVTKTDDTTKTVISTGFYTDDAGFTVGQDVTLDDGTGTQSVPATNIAHGTVNTVDLVYKNFVGEVTALPPGKMNTDPLLVKLEYGIDKTSIVDLGDEDIKYIDADGNEQKLETAKKFSMNLNVPLTAGNEQTELDDKHIVVDAMFTILAAGGSDYAYAQITKVTINPAGAQPAFPIIEVLCLAKDNSLPIDPTLFDKVSPAEILNSDDGHASMDSLFVADTSLGLFDTNYNLYGTTTLKTVTLTTAPGDTYLIYELEVGSYSGIPADVSNAELLNASNETLYGFTLFSRAFFQGRTYQDLLLIPIDSAITVNLLDIADCPIVAGNTVLVDENVKFSVPGVLAPNQITVGTDDFVVFNWDIAQLSWPVRQQLYTLLTNATSPELCEDTFDTYLSITLNTADTLTNLLTRIWQGVDIQDTTRVILYDGNNTLDTSLYDILVKGDKVAVQETAIAVEDHIVSHSCGRAEFLVTQVGECEFGLIPDSQDMLAASFASSPYRIVIARRAGNLEYQLFDNGNRYSLNRAIRAYNNDRIVVQWGVTPSANDFEWGTRVNSQTQAAIATFDKTVRSSGNNYQKDKSKMLFSVTRNGKIVDNWIYFGCPSPNVNDALFPQTAEDTQLARCVPWTPRANPYLPPIEFDNSQSFHVYVCPNQAAVQIVELTPTGKFTTLENGAVVPISGDNYLYHPDMHNNTNLDADYSLTKYNSLTNSYTLTFTDAEVQKLLGYKLSTITLTGLTNSWTAQIDYLRAYLPEGIVILLESLNCDTYDLGQFNGSRRNIIATAIDTQSKAGEVSIEPANLYRVALGNKQPINLRKFALAFEDLNGNRLLLANAKVTVCLLFE
jgi:hypothetical protein